MKSYVKEFNYSSKDKVSQRKLFVMRENETAMDGFELTYLSDEEVKALKEAYADHEVKGDFSKSVEKKEDYDNAWGRAWRRYNKVNIVPEKEECDGTCENCTCGKKEC